MLAVPLPVHRGDCYPMVDLVLFLRFVSRTFPVAIA